MGGPGSGWWGKGRAGASHTEASRAAIRAGMAKAQEEGRIAPPLALSGFEPIVGEYLAIIGWHPFICRRCGAYKLGPLGMVECVACSKTQFRAVSIEITAIHQEALWQKRM